MNFCRDCINYRCDERHMHGVCLRTGELRRNLVTGAGTIEYRAAEVERGDVAESLGGCGPNAKHFEAKPEPKPSRFMALLERVFTFGAPHLD